MKSKAFLKDFMLYGCNNIAAKLIALIVIPIITSVFTVGEYGIIDTGISVISLLPLFIGMGYDMVLKRDLIIYKDEPQKSRDLVFTIFLFLAIWGAVAAVVLALLRTPLSRLLFLSDKYSNTILFAVISVYFNTFIGFVLILCRTKFKIKRYTIISIIRTILEYAMIIIAILYFKKGVNGYFAAICIVDFIYAAVVMFIHRKDIGGRFNKTLLKKSLKFGVPTMIAGIGYWIFNLSDRILITILSSSTETGYYSISIKMLAVYTFLITAFKQAWIPRAFEMYREDKESFSRHIETMHHYSLAFFSLFALTNYAGLRLMILVFSKPAYLPGILIAMPLVLAYILYPLADVASIGLYLTGKTRQLSYVVWFAAIINIVINVIWIPVYGSLAAGISTLASYLFIYIVYWVLTCIYMHWKFSWLKPAIVLIFTVAVTMGIYMISIENLFVDLALKLAVVGVFIAVLLVTKIIRINFIKRTVKYLFKK